MRVSLVAEQLLQPIPGGIGTYTRALIRHLPAFGVAVDPIVAWHTDAELHEAGVSQARRLRLPRQALYARWTRGRKRPVVSGGCDLVHAPSLAFPPRERKPLVVTVHDVLFRQYPDAYPKRGVEFHERALERIADASLILCPSKATAQDLKGLGVEDARMRVVPNGTDFVRPSNAERDRELDRLQVSRPYVLWAGTVEPRKNPEGVIRGFVHAVADMPRRDDLKLYLVGPPGWWSGDVGQLVESRGMADRVRRLQAPWRSFPSLYSGAEAFVFPSFAEGFGLPVLEAMACGTPVVTSNRSALPEVAGSAALLCDPDDDESIGAALARVLRDRELAEDLRQLGYRRAAEFGWDRTAQHTAQCYRELLA